LCCPQQETRKGCKTKRQSSVGSCSCWEERRERRRILMSTSPRHAWRARKTLASNIVDQRLLMTFWTNKQWRFDGKS
jgi:hypothetical protein